MNNHLLIITHCRNRSYLISNSLVFVVGWGPALDPAGELTTFPRSPNRERFCAFGTQQF